MKSSLTMSWRTAHSILPHVVLQMKDIAKVALEAEGKHGNGP